ncbi:hypothetical protein EHQ27_07840 [Leptospira wolffii]|uniref:LIC_11485 family protein n=1 Tax=Leptospira wolffii TaxID=409998 RepID=UPI00108320A5|nr:hypothetical protein [Leptospira wolffii]TGK60021.1 hypothetical protein EHQ32_08915 [Leptospira wolffii]TGK72365.1 hypothetical protein EHQ27_07840 [Leptospira wolffii]TGK76028.1 hypothetical protein EHQ35_01665 [Leptospira wolffii]TGL30280.1 hypothetical protein EHQ57_07635 [Leptospira wolffii]
MAFNPFSILTKIRESIDGILGNLPPKTVKTIAMAGLALAVLIAIALSWFSFQKGLEMAGEEDRAKVLDRKALFLEDIEREYNRKRKEIHWSDPSYSDSGSSSLDIERYSLDKPKEGPVSPKPELEETDNIRNSRRREGDSKVFFPNDEDRPPKEDLGAPGASGNSPQLDSGAKPGTGSSGDAGESRLSRPPRKEQKLRTNE